MLKTRAIKIVRDSKINSIIAKQLNKEMVIKSKVIIDTSGFSSVTARELEMNTWNRYDIGAECECYADNAEDDTWALMDGSNYTPAGYAWIFPLKKHRIRIGVSRPESNTEPLVLLGNMIRG